MIQNIMKKKVFVPSNGPLSCVVCVCVRERERVTKACVFVAVTSHTAHYVVGLVKYVRHFTHYQHTHTHTHTHKTVEP